MDEKRKAVLDWLRKEFGWTEEGIIADWLTCLQSDLTTHGTLLDFHTPEGLGMEKKIPENILKIIKEM